MAKSVFQSIEEIGIVPVINIGDPEKAVALAKALIDGGIPVIEVTLRSETAIKSLARIHERYPEMLVGAGTVITIEQVDMAVAEGASFVVSPGLDEKLVEYCLKIGMPILPGAVTATEIQKGVALGLKTFKFFPNDQVGSIDSMKALKGPFPDIKFVPTSGVNLTNLEQLMAFPGVAAAGGSFMAKADVIAAEDWDTITNLCKKCVDISLGFKLMHVGIHCSDANESLKTAQWFSDLFNFPVKVGNSSDFAGTAVECMKTKYLGKPAHIGISTFSALRAKAYFEKKGIGTREYKYNDKGEMFSFYLDEEIADFAVHVTQK